MARTVTVTGHGSVQVVPDRAVARLSAVVRAGSGSEALAGVSSVVDTITARARELVDSAQIGSVDLHLWPAHDHEGRPVGFEARHTLVLGCPSLEVAAELVGALVAAGGDAVQVEGLSLETTEVAGPSAEARAEAYRDAVARATHLAGLGGDDLGEVLALSEGPTDHLGERDARPAAMAKSMRLEPGERALTAELTVTFALVGPAAQAGPTT